MKIAIALLPLLMAGCGQVGDAAYYAVGSADDLGKMRVAAHDCGASQMRIDKVDDTQWVFVTYGASAAAKDCFRKWVNDNAPDIELTAPRLKEMGYDA